MDGCTLTAKYIKTNDDNRRRSKQANGWTGCACVRVGEQLCFLPLLHTLH